MADGSLTGPQIPAHATSSPLRASWRGLPASLRVALIYLGARAITTAIMLGVAAFAAPGSRHGPNPSVFDFVLGWDAQWYWLIAESGYPLTLPTGVDGAVVENAWAFMPVYAYLAKWVGFGVWGAGALFISLLSGYLACLVFYRLMCERLDRSAATWAVIFLACGPMAAMFQVGYAESLALLWLLLALWCVVHRRFGWLYLLVPLMGFTRPGVLAFALMLAMYGIWRWMRRRSDPLPPTQIVHIVALGLFSALVGFAWPVIVGFATGDAGAYLATELAWRRPWVGEGVFIPFSAWVQGAEFWFGRAWGLGAVTGYVVLALLLGGAAAALLLLPCVRRLQVEVRLWAAAYIVYLLAVFFPQSSVFRLLFPLSPLWGAVAVPRSPWWRGGVFVACVLGQWCWIALMYGVGTAYWQVP
ncbi:MAG TPA: hypothetical protein PLA13_03440 [Microbacteriaceae bacterium]|nr:hypothetical protein [Microbacteriaceae bacterium]HQX35390.1 hypothetical protein [Microbacteriaceae bacterium]HQZ48681.1 hypothetical protein [Microbacteriaceae bacterium]HRA07947.1 hypothetical protein [Microbacteriaceae bacterium]